jgi:biotin operon repressor
VATSSLSDRLLAILGDPVAGALVRRLAKAPATQAELVSETGCSQAAASRWIGELRTAGVLVEEPASGRAAVVALSCRDEIVAAFLAADRLAEAALTHQADAQARRSEETRRLAMRPTSDEEANDATS